MKEQFELRPKWLDLTLRGILLVFSNWLMGIEVRQLSQSALQMLQVILEAFSCICSHLCEALMAEDWRNMIEDCSHEK